MIEYTNLIHDGDFDMSAICGFLVFLFIFLCVPASIIMLFIFAIMKKGVKIPLCCLVSCILLIIILSILGTYSHVKSEEYQDYITEKGIEENKEEEDISQNNSVVDESIKEEIITHELTNDNDSEEDEAQPVDKEYSEEIDEETQTEELQENTGLTEEDYKELCVELWHDDIFFSKENLVGKHVKLNLLIEEDKYFKADSIYNSTVVDFVNKYNLQRELYACGVLREDSDSYVGGQIYLYFSDDYNCKASDHETGQEIIIYGDIVDYSTNTWDGYNTCGVIPRYTEVK